jgi:hypothetical protein
MVTATLDTKSLPHSSKISLVLVIVVNALYAEHFLRDLVATLVPDPAFYGIIH